MHWNMTVKFLLRHHHWSEMKSFNLFSSLASVRRTYHVLQRVHANFLLRIRPVSPPLLTQTLLWPLL